MNLTRFAIAAGATPKWVLNAHALLGIRRIYDEARAQLFALTCELAESSLPLQAAYRTAEAMLALGPRGGDQNWEEPLGGMVWVRIDQARFLTRWGLALAWARRPEVERRRGRPARLRQGLSGAEEYGVDLSLLRASLNRSPAERLQRLDEDREFLQSLRVRPR